MGAGSPASAPEGGLQGGFGVVACQQEVTLPGHEVRDGTRESGGQDPARLRGHQTVILAVPDLDGHPDLAGGHTPGPGLERVVVRGSAASLPERCGPRRPKITARLVSAAGWLLGRMARQPVLSRAPVLPTA